MADIKFSEFPKATTSKDSDEMAILQDGVNKMIASPVLESKIINKTVSRVIDQGGASLNLVNLKGVVPTYADLALITPTPELNDAYQVEADGLVYVYTENGFQADGEGLDVSMKPIGLVEEGNPNAVSGGEVFNSLVINNINKGKSYPYINQPEILTPALIKLNNMMLDVQIDETTHQDTLEYAVTLIARNAGTSNNWGNAIHIRVLNSETLEQQTAISLRSTDASLSAENIRQLNKIEKGGLQKISLNVDSLNRIFHITIDTDSIADGEIIDGSYSTAATNKMHFNASVYNIVRVIPSITNLATKQEVIDATDPLNDWKDTVDSITVNKGKSYPMIGLPTTPTVTANRANNLKNILLDAEITKFESGVKYFIGGFYKNNAQQGSGFIIARRLTNGVAGGSFVTTLGTNAPSLANKAEIESKFALGGIQKFNLKIEAFGLELSLTIDIDAITSGYMQMAYQDYDNWLEADFSTNVYQSLRTAPPISNGVPFYPTFKKALQDEFEGLFKVGNTLAQNKISPVVFNGDNANFKPSDVNDQYQILNGGIKNNIDVKGDLITVRKWDGTGNANITWVSKTKMYFVENPINSFVIASNIINSNPVTKESNNYQLVTIPNQLTGAENNNQIRKVIELPNGELLIETRAGEQAEGGD